MYTTGFGSGQEAPVGAGVPVGCQMGMETGDGKPGAGKGIEMGNGCACEWCGLTIGTDSRPRELSPSALPIQWLVAKWHNSDDRVDNLNATAAHGDPHGPGELASTSWQQQLHLNAKWVQVLLLLANCSGAGSRETQRIRRIVGIGDMVVVQ